MSADAFPPFHPRAPWWGADLQTIRNTLRPAPRAMAGGAQLLLTMRDGDKLAARLDLPAQSSARPLIVLIHGLTGSQASVNIVATARHLLREGWRVLRLNLRGSAFSRPTSRGRYHAGRTADLAQALSQLPAALTHEGVVLVGHSLGGNLVLKFMGEGRHALPARGAVAVSTPLDLSAASQRFLAPRNALYHWHLLRALKAEATAPRADLTDAQRAAIGAARSIFAFDDRFVAPAFGYRDAEDYYTQNASMHFLGGVAEPTLVIHALDDPWIPADSYVAVDWARLPAIETALAPQGGHLGFHGVGSSVGWHDRVTAQWLARRFGA